MRTIEDFTGAKKEVDCIGCACVEAGTAVPGHIIETELFQAHQDQEVPIPGFVILATKRHIASVDEFTENEAAEFVALLRRIRHAQRTVLGIATVYLIQEEDTRDHFHLWLLPRYEWMNDEEKFGRRVSSARPVLKHAREHMKTPDNIAEVLASAARLRDFLNN